MDLFLNLYLYLYSVFYFFKYEQILTRENLSNLPTPSVEPEGGACWTSDGAGTSDSDGAGTPASRAALCH